GGHAQYFNLFVSPVSPNAGHITFIAWTQVVRLLDTFELAIPEYYQFLVLTLVVLPFLTYLFLGCLARLLFRTRTAVVLTVLVYAFSGIGLWNQAWFYYQEPATLFLLLATAVALLQRPSAVRALLFLLAVLIQFCSLNYWTLYNSWFILI